MCRLRTQMQHSAGRLGPRTVAAHGTARSPAFCPGSRLWVIGGTDDAFPRIDLRAGPPLGLASRQVVILLPDLAQELHTSLILERLRSIGLFQRLQQMQSVSANLLC